MLTIKDIIYRQWERDPKSAKIRREYFKEKPFGNPKKFYEKIKKIFGK